MVHEIAISRLMVAIAMVSGPILRLWQINAMGFNTDEAVYAGQAAAIAGVSGLKDIFPIFRAHPLLIQFLLSLIYKVHFSDVAGRYLAVAFGLGAVYLTYMAGKTLYGRFPGALAALFLALMPYHVTVSPAVPAGWADDVLCHPDALLLARFGKTRHAAWFYAAGAASRIDFSIQGNRHHPAGAVFVFLALSPDLHLRFRDLVIALVLMVLAMAPMPLTLLLAGRNSTGNNYLVYQLLRRPNHDGRFYLQVIPPALGIMLLVVAILSLVFLWRERSWRETLLMSWVFVTAIFFQIWPVKGFQYLLPIAPAIALLAGRLLGRLAGGGQDDPAQEPALNYMAVPPVLTWVVVGCWPFRLASQAGSASNRSASSLFLAGTGGIPGGREAGT